MFREVEKLAGLHGIFLRTGCFCNPGACARHLGISASQSKRNFEAGHVCWDDNDIIDGRWDCSPVCLQCSPMAVSTKGILCLLPNWTAVSVKCIICLSAALIAVCTIGILCLFAPVYIKSISCFLTDATAVSVKGIVCLLMISASVLFLFAGKQVIQRHAPGRKGTQTSISIANLAVNHVIDSAGSGLMIYSHARSSCCLLLPKRCL